MTEPQITIVLPPVASGDDDDGISDNLRALTEMLCKKAGDSGTGGLGGTYGYGLKFENDTFVMNPYYWGDCTCDFEEKEGEWSENNHHSEDCYQSELKRLKIEKGWTRDENLDFMLDAPKGMPFDEQKKIEDEIYAFLMKKHDKPKLGCAVHCTCHYEPNRQAWLAENDHAHDCLLIQPNFLHKETGFRVDWYKYIGRGMEIDAPDGVDIQEVFRDCIRSIQG